MGEEALTHEIILSLGFKEKSRNPFIVNYEPDPTKGIPISIEDRGHYSIHQINIMHDPERSGLEITGKVGGVEETFYNGYCWTMSDFLTILRLWGYGL